jgi:ATP-binding cassette subfamily B protein
MNFFRDPDFRALLRREPRTLATGLFFLLCRSGVGVWQPILLGRAMDSCFEGRPRAETLGLAAWFLVAAAAAAVCQYWMRKILVAASRDYEYDARSALFRRLLAQGGDFFDRSRTGDLVSRLTSDLEAVRMGVGPGVMYLLDTGIRTVCALVAMTWLSPVLTAWAVIPLAVTVYGMKRILHRVQDLSLAVQEEQGALSARAQESFSGARVVKAFAREEAEIARFTTLSRSFVDANLRLAESRAAFACLIEAAGAGVLVLLLLVGGHETLAGRFSVGAFATFIGYLQMLVWPMIAFGWVLGLWQRANASASRLDELRREVPAVADPPQPRLPEGGVRGALEFRNLRLRRPGGEAPVLDGVSFVVPAGTSLGIIGRTGAGKSTLVQTTARLIDPPPGTVFLDGVDVRDYALDDLRRAVGFVPQETVLFSDTLRQNVLFGAPDASAERTADAVRRSCLDEAVEGFPAGLDTLVGERGVTLSGGQRQRAAIARALVVDPRVLVLDDCLSAVDAETEERVFGRLADVLKSRTSLVVSHRASAVARLDRVVVLEAGRVVEEGPPAALLRADGPFAALARLQRAEEELETL